MKHKESIERQYLNHAADLIAAPHKSDRTGTGTQSIFGHQMTHDMREGFPLLTTKFVALRLIVHELIWFLNGDTNIKYLNENGVNIWNEWATEKGELGPVYGAQWRNFNGVDQIRNLLVDLLENPTSRRHIISAWNPAVLPLSELTPSQNALAGRQALPPCHTFFQVNCEEKTDGGYFVDLQLYQRSADWFLGVPFNIASYALLLLMIAYLTGYTARRFIHTFGDTHLYSNHKNQMLEQLSRKPRALPRLHIVNCQAQALDEFQPDDFVLDGYQYHPAISAPISV